MIKSGHPDGKLIAERQSSLEHLVRSLQRKAAIRQHRLMESLFRHEYFVESDELESWIAENLQHASSEDYGQDFEHLLVILLNILLFSSFLLSLIYFQVHKLFLSTGGFGVVYFMKCNFFFQNIFKQISNLKF